MRLNADKIRWTENALQELERLLGTKPEIEIADLEDSLGGLDFPWPITIKEIKAETDVQGRVWVNLIIEFDEINGAGGYEVRLTVSDDDNQIEIVDPQTTLTAAQGGPEGNDIIEGAISGHKEIQHPAVEANDLGILVGPGNAHRGVNPPDLTDGPKGGFTTWTAIYNPNDGNMIGAWKGTGAGVGYTNYGNHGPLVDRGFGGLALLKGWGAATIKEVSVGTYYIPAGGLTTISTNTITADPGDMIIAGIDTVDDFFPDGTKTDTGFSGLYVRNWETGIYANGCAISAGISTTGGTVKTDFGVTSTTGTDYCQTIIMRIGY